MVVGLGRGMLLVGSTGRGREYTSYCCSLPGPGPERLKRESIRDCESALTGQPL